MTIREHLNSLSDEDFAEWLCRQLWEDYEEDDVINVVRYNQIRNFLKMEFEPKEKVCTNRNMAN